MDFIKLSETGALKICGYGNCMACYNCGHTNKESCATTLPLIGENDICPLAKYNVMPHNDDKPWYKTPRSEREPSKDEMFALCARCKNTDGVELLDNGMMQITKKDLMMCCDCPVKMIQESMEECEAETETET